MSHRQMRSLKGGASDVIYSTLYVGIALVFLSKCAGHVTTTVNPNTSPPPLRGAARQMYGSGSLRPPGVNPAIYGSGPRLSKMPISSPAPNQKPRTFFIPMPQFPVPVPIPQHDFDKLHGYPFLVPDAMAGPGMISSPRSGIYSRPSTRVIFGSRPEHSVRGMYGGRPEYYDLAFIRGKGYIPIPPDYGSKPGRGIVVRPENFKGPQEREETHQEHPCGGDCPKGEFLCITSCICIKEEDRCDGHMDCDNNEDELECGEVDGSRKCDLSDRYVQCPKTGRCISKDWLCDGDDDCGDFTDETHCGFRVNCTVDQYECANGLCIPKTWVCDKDNDCKDFSDEVNCTRTGCSEDEFTCNNGSCISLNWKCDKQPDCDDGSDEAECDIEPLPCNKGEYSCGNQVCIKGEFKCDGDNDCGDWSDEYDCPKGSGSCTPGEYKCHSGKCILDKWRCDKQQDCEDNEDEANCDESHMRTCSAADEFTCNNGACILNTWVCDGVFDCDHNEDESECHHTCDDSKFACSGVGLNDTTTQFCINKKHVCDGQKDCPKGEDERECPTKRECEKGSNCSQLCISTADGRNGCSCNIGYSLSPDGVSCQDINECLYMTDPVCSQTCNNTVGSFRCGCMTGYILRPDLRSCKALGAPPTLLFANRVDIRQVSLSNQKYTALLKGLHNAIALDYHYEKKLIFWSDVSIDVIKRAYVNGTGVTDIIKWGLDSPGGVAMDWIHDLLFWTDSGTRRIEVASLDGKERAIIAASDLDKPRAIAVHPGEALLFWTDWGPNPKIEKADMDGGNRKSIITDSVFWPNGLTIDYTSDRIYWADAKHNVIENALFDGGDRKKVISKGLPHPFALTIFEDAIYWTDWHTKSISTANKVTGTGLRTIHSRLHFPMDIHSYHSQRQPLYRNHCGTKNGGCAHMCLPNSKNYTCVCPMGQKLKPDGSCLKPEKLLIFTTKKDLRLKHLDKNAVHQHEMVIPVDGIKSAVALAWDSKTDTVFWTDVERDTINKAHWNGSDQQILVYSNIISPAGLAYDWITEKIYWTDAGSSHIEVANSDGSMRGILIWEGLDKPRDIVLDPLGGYMYWSDWGAKPKIERTAMDGSMRMVVIALNLTWPNGLAIDHSTGRLYWADGGTKLIEYSNLDGSNRHVLIEGPDLPHPFGLDVFGNFIYWTDWQSSSIESANKLTGFNRTLLQPGTSGLMDVRVFHRTRKVNKNACGTQNGGCSHLCLLKPKGHTCSCPIGIKLERDGKTCTNGPVNSLILAHRFDIRQISLDVPYIVDVVLPFHQLKNVMSVDVDRKTGEIYWTDTAKDVIEKSTPDGKNVQSVITHELLMVDAIAIDSTGRKIYWTDGERNSIEVAELDGSNRKVLVWSNLDSPRAITLHYHHGLMFWSDWGTPAKIEVAQMDGSNRLTLITEKLVWPNGLAVDRPQGRLYWNDGKLHTIESSDLHGKDRKVILTDVPHPYGLVVVGNHMYWTDWQTQGLHRAEKSSGADRAVIRRNLDGLMDIRSVQMDNIAENACGLDNGRCSHLCLRNSKSFMCACPTGLRMSKDNKTCQYQPENYLLFATRSALARISLDTPELWDVTLPIMGINHAIDVDFHWKKRLLFYTDVKKHKIQSVNMQNFSEIKDVVSVNVTAPNGVAVDWIADNIYWTDTDAPLIEVAKLDGSCRKVIVKENLLEPRSIAIFPRKGYLFWTEWGKEPKIERSFLDGTSRKTIIANDLGFPNGLMIDYKGKRLYWTDARWDRIENSDLNGKNRIQLVHSSPDILDTHPFGLTLFEDFIYWTDWYQKSIVRADRATGKNAAIVRSNLDGAMGITAVSETRQLGWNPCATENGGCSHFCFHKLTNYTCGCPDVVDSTCSTGPKQWILISKPHDDYEDDDDEEKSYYDPNIAVFDDILPEHTDTELPQRFYIMTLIPILCIILLSIVLLTVVILYKKSKKKYLYATGRSVRTFSNPNYYTSGSEAANGVANNVDRRQFLWKRLKYDKSQDRVYEVKTGSSSPEVVSLIPNVLTPSSSNCEAVTPELDRSPSVTPLHRTDSIQPAV